MARVAAVAPAALHQMIACTRCTGYMGHITYIANKLLEAGMQSEQMRAYMDAHAGWQVSDDSVQVC